MNIIAHTPTIKFSDMMPARIVLTEKPGEYIVHYQTLEDGKHFAFYQGDYFRFNSENRQLALCNAYECFMKRAEQIQARMNSSETWTNA